MKGISLGPRAQAVLVLTLVAALGALLGILGDRYVAQQRSRGDDVRAVPMAPRAGGPDRVRFIDRMAEHLELTDEQRTAIDSILAQQQVRVRALTREYQPQFRTIAEDTRHSIEAVLTPEQRERMRTLRRDRLRGLDERRALPDLIRPGPPNGRRMPRDTGG